MRRFFSMTMAMVLFIPLVAVSALLWVFQVSEGQQALLRHYARVTEQTLRAERLNAESERLARLGRAYILIPEPGTLVDLQASRDLFDALQVQMASEHLDAEERTLLEEIERADTRIRAIAMSLHQLRQEGMSLEALQPRLAGDYQSERLALDERLRALLRHERERMDALSVRAHQAMDDSGRAHLLAVPIAATMLAAQAVLTLHELHRRQRAQAVAERNAAERAASEARYSGIVSLAADAILTLDEAQRITLFNAGAEAIFGHRSEEVLGQPLDVLLPERFRAPFRAHVQRFLEQGVPPRKTSERQSLMGLRKGGEPFPLDATLSRLEVEGQRTLTLILRDISEQKRLEDEQAFLVGAGEFLSSTSLDHERTLSRVAQLAVQSIADGCLVHLWEDGRVRLSEVVHRDPSRQAQAASLRGLLLDVQEPFLARDVFMTRRSLLLPRLTPEQTEAFAQSEAHLRLLRLLAPRSVMAVPLLANGRLLGVLVLLASESGRLYTPRDLEFAEQLGRYSSLAVDNACLYRSARDATLARDKVLGVVAHDLRSPLFSLRLTLKTLQRQAPRSGSTTDERNRRSLDMLTRSTDRMSRLIDDLLDVVRVEAGQLSIRASPHPAEPLLQEALETARPQAPEHHLLLELSEALPSVLVDRDRLLQVFSNLLGNAMKFTPPGGEVRVGARVEGSSVIFSVTDTGPGIPPEVREHLFERFWQAHRGDRRGAGLGLSIVKGIVEAHGGSIRVESAPGHGSAFLFSVPIAASATAASLERLDTAGSA